METSEKFSWLEDTLLKSHDGNERLESTYAKEYTKFFESNPNVEWIPSYRVLDLFSQLKIKDLESMSVNAKHLESGVVTYTEHSTAAMDFVVKSASLKKALLNERCDVRQLGPNHTLYDKTRSVQMLGLFAKKAIPANTAIGEYIGIARLLDKNNQREEEKFLRNEYTYECVGCDFNFTEKRGTYNIYIDASEIYNNTRFANDNTGITEFPNCKFFEVWFQRMPHVVLMTVEDVMAGEELTVDYGANYWSGAYQSELDEKLKPEWALPLVSRVVRTKFFPHEYETERVKVVLKTVLSALVNSEKSFNKLRDNTLMYMSNEGVDVPMQVVQSIKEADPHIQEIKELGLCALQTRTVETTSMEEAANISAEFAHRLAVEGEVTVAVMNHPSGAVSSQVLDSFDVYALVDVGDTHMAMQPGEVATIRSPDVFSDGDVYMLVDGRKDFDRFDFFSRAYSMDLLNVQNKTSKRQSGKLWMVLKTKNELPNGQLPSVCAHLMDCVNRRGKYQVLETTFRGETDMQGSAGNNGGAEGAEYSVGSDANVAIVQTLQLYLHVPPQLQTVTKMGILYRFYLVATRNINQGELLTVKKDKVFWHSMFLDGVANLSGARLAQGNNPESSPSEILDTGNTKKKSKTTKKTGNKKKKTKIVTTPLQ